MLKAHGTNEIRIEIFFLIDQYVTKYCFPFEMVVTALTVYKNTLRVGSF